MSKQTKMKRFRGGEAELKSIGNGRVKGYLVRFTDETHRDLQDEYFSKRTNFMRNAGFPIKGSPILYDHGLSDFGSVGIGVFDLVDEDDVGVFVQGKLFERKDYELMLEEVNARKSLGLRPSVIKRKAKLAEQAVKSVLSTVSHNWSMGAYPPTFQVENGHITQCAIVEGSLTVQPAEPNGTEAKSTYQKSIQNAFSLSDVAATETKVSGSAQGEKKASITSWSWDVGEGNLANSSATIKTIEQGVKMDMQAFREGLAALMAMIDQSEMEEMAEDKQVPPEELEEEVAKAAEEMLEEDEEAAAKMEEEEKEEEKEEGAKSRRTMNKWLEENFEEIISRGISRVEKRKTAITAGFRKAANASHPTSKRERAGAYGSDPNRAATQIGKAQKPGLAEFIKSAANHDFRPFYGKAQNPYIGEQGGYLLGQELSNEILPPLRENVVAFDAGVKQTNLASGVGTYTIAKMSTAPTAYRPGINTAVTAADAKFETITAFLRPIAAMTVIPFQLLEQSPLAVEQSIRDEMIRSIALQIDIEILNGTGTVTGTQTGAEIRGVKTVLEGDTTLSSSNIATLATNGRKPIFSDASAAETQIATGNVPDTEPKSWIMHARSRGRYRDLTATTGEPLFRENFGNEAFARLIGYPVHVGNQISITDTTGTSSTTSEIYFGAWRYAEYVMQNQLEIIVDRVTLANQLQARIIAYTYSDFIIHYPKAFYVMKGVT